ncbi:hypothetical protein GIY30_10160 [Gordonia sp. HNM0687]|uniref:Transmembrane protein n=1 Tax=Gordonia mangrovi TaxID=2665643 RepID=A0A6L7GPC2_9ACTN|nr:hypothetical protein [Gordonia mangrovi]MXP21710.1 hypothetical protein [Gordonia mangrovi]UVF80442.1 hypothetical protein NWF22_11755 [Gordonia mangrovi]
MRRATNSDRGWVRSVLTPRRWPIARLLSRNPLVRSTDRIEALTLCLAAALALVAIPLSVLVHDEVSAAQTAAMERQAQTIHSVQATAVDDASAIVTETGGGAIVTARWTYNAVPHTGSVNVVDGSINAGERFDLWVDQRGEATRGPLTAAEAAMGSVLTAIAFYLAVLALTTLLVVAARAVLRRFRHRAWDIDLALLTGSGGGHLHR